MLRMLRRSNVEAGTINAGSRPQEFDVSLNKSSGSSLGLGLDYSTLVVTHIVPEGLVAAWNAANPGKDVKVGHKIVQVNSKSEIPDIIEKLKEQDSLELRFSREVEVATSQPAVDMENVAANQDGAPLSPRAMKAWLTDVSSEETPSPGISHLKNKFDVSNELSGGVNDGKDGDLVELPSPSIQTCLLSHSSLSPHDPAPLSALTNTALGPGDIQVLRDLAARTSAAKAGIPPDQASNNAAARAMWTVSSSGAPSQVPDIASSPLMSMPSTSGGEMARGNSRESASSLGVPPDDNEGRDIAPVHSSLSTASPSLHQTLHQNGGQTFRPQTSSEAPFPGTALGDPNRPLDQYQLQTHGAGSTAGTVGFMAGGPFWTCGSTPAPRFARQKAASASNPSSILGGLFRNSERQAAAAISGPLDLSSRISTVLGSCVNMLSSAIDVSDDPEPPEDELTTVLMETKEQRLQWRDFLSEAVSKCRAGTLYNSFDVEPDPPKYARPPLSAAPKVDAAVRSYRQSGKSPPHVVAPRGAGWSPIGPHSGSNVEERSIQPYAYSGISAADPDQAEGGSSSSAGGNCERTSLESDAARANSGLPVLGAPVTASPVRSGQDLSSRQGDEYQPSESSRRQSEGSGAGVGLGIGGSLPGAATSSLSLSSAPGGPASSSLQSASSGDQSVRPKSGSLQPSSPAASPRSTAETSDKRPAPAG